MKKYFVLIATCLLGLTSCDNAVQQEQETTYPNEVIETIMTRRSVRQYNDEPISHEVMDKILECGIHAPNGMNAQRWEVRVVESKKWIDDVTAAYKNSLTEDSPMAEQFKDPNFKNMFRNAPAVIFVAAEPSAYAGVDCGILAENMMLAAHELGLGTCCLGMPIPFMNSKQGEPFLASLGLPEGYALQFAIAIGYADETPEAKPRDASKIEFIN